MEKLSNTEAELKKSVAYKKKFVTRLKVQHFNTKLPCQNPMLGQIEWGVQYGPTTKNGILPLTALFLQKT